MKKLLTKILLLFLLCHYAMAQEGNVVQEIRNLAVSDVSPLKELVEKKINEKGTVNIDLYMGSMYEDGIIIQQAILPLVKMYEDKVNFQIHYFENGKDVASPILSPSKKMIKEGYRQIAIETLHPKLFLDYLLLRGEDLFKGKAETAVQALKMDEAELSKYMRKSAPALYNASVAYSNTMHQVQDKAILVVDGEAQIFTVLDYLVNSCPNYFNCLESCTDINLIFASWTGISCTACINAIQTGSTFAIQLACAGCVISSAGTIIQVSDFLECLDNCDTLHTYWPNPNDLVAVQEAHSCNGNQEYCVNATYDQAWVEEDLTTSSCISCASDQDIGITTINSANGLADYFSFTIPEPELDEFPLLYTLIEPKPIIQYHVEYQLNGLVVNGFSQNYDTQVYTPYPGSNPLDRYYGDYAMYYPAANIDIGDELQIHVTPVEEPLNGNCLPVSKQINFDCPTIELVPNYENNTFYISVDIPENSPFIVTLETEYSTYDNPFRQTLTESGNSHTRTFDPNSNQQITISSQIMLAGTFSILRVHDEYEECAQEIVFNPAANRCYGPENIIGLSINNIENINLTNGMTHGSADFEITNTSEPVDWFLIDGNNNVVRSALNTTDYTGTLSNLPHSIYTLQVNFTFEGTICQRKSEFPIVIFCSNFVTCQNPILLDAIVNDASAGDQSNGSIKMLNFGLTYLWSDLPSPTTDPKRNNLSPGEYCVEAYDSECCFDQACYTIGPNCDLDFSYSMDAPCKGKKNGAIDFYPSGGTPPYYVSWSNGDSGTDIVDLPAGDYSFTLTDANRCLLTQTISVPNMGDLVNIQADPATHSIQLIYTGSPVNFHWSGPGITSDNKHSLILEDLPFGIYCLFIKTAEGCEYKECINFSEPLSIAMENLSCFEDFTGVENTTYVCINTTGGSGDYSYEWSNIYAPYGERCAIVLGGQEFCVTVTDNSLIDPPSISECWTIGDLSVELISSQAPCKNESNGQICVQASGGGPSYFYFWPDTPVPVLDPCSPANLEGGQTYVVTVTDDCQNSTTFSHYLPEVNQGPDITDVEIVKACTNSSNGSITLEVTGGSGNMTYAWSSTSIAGRSTLEPSLNGIPSGLYYVEITHLCGVSKKFGPFEVGTTGNDDFPIDLVWEVLMDCNFPATPDGAITFSNPLENGDLSFQWENGSSSPSPSNLRAGDYRVTVTLPNGCEAVDVVNVPASGDFILSRDVMGSCGNNNNGAIDLEIAPGNYNFAWSNGASSTDLSNLSPGSYKITVTDIASGCTEVETFEVVDDNNNPDFTYSVEVTHFFGNESYTSGAARVLITSEFFSTLGTISLNNTPVTGFVPNNSNTITLFIPLEYRNFDTFVFVYESLNGCTYEGHFETVPTCDNTNDAFSFNVEHIGDVEEGCELGQFHSYNINVFHVGDNPPYFVEAKMINAFDTAFSDYLEVFTYNGPTNFSPPQGPEVFTVSGIPSGEVYFRSYNKCNNGDFVGARDINCCSDITCEILSESYDPEGEGTSSYRLNFFELNAIDLCFDDQCGGLFQDSDCSEVIPELLTFPPVNNCWFGTVTIDYPGGPDAVFTVSPDVDTDGIDVYDELEWISNVSWEPPGSGTYTITVTYEGDPEIGSGVNCEQELEITFYGASNYEEVIGFNDNFWFSSTTIPEHFFNSYHGAWKCQKCGPGDYIFNNDQDQCTEFFNWEFTHFNFEPLDYSNPCNSGGLLTLMSYNENEEPLIQTIDIAPDQAIDQYLGARAFESPNDNWCNSGWCLFDGNEIYGINSFDKPILATWFDPQSCIPLETIEINCNEDYPCFVGECDNGICVESDDCFPECPEDYICEEGFCILDEPYPCETTCDCPEGQTCEDGECVDLPAGMDCTASLGDCQCPENYTCEKGQCVFDAEYPNCDEDHPCPPGEYCKRNECIDCPVFTVNHCYGQSDCPSDTDCILDLYISSDHSVLTTINIIRDGTNVGNYNYSIWNTPRHIPVPVPPSCDSCVYSVILEFDSCPTTTIVIPNYLNCGPGITSNHSKSFFKDNHSGSNEIAGEIASESSSFLINGVNSKSIPSDRFLLYPNPFDEVINVEYTSEIAGSIDLLLTDIYGRQLQSEAFPVSPGLNKKQIQLNQELAPGVYYVQVADQQGAVKSFKLIHYKLKN